MSRRGAGVLRNLASRLRRTSKPTEINPETVGEDSPISDGGEPHAPWEVLR